MNTQNLNSIEQASKKAGSQRALSLFLGVSAAYINQLCKTGAPPAIRHCKKIADEFHIPLSKLRPHDWKEIWPDLKENQCDT